MKHQDKYTVELRILDDRIKSVTEEIADLLATSVHFEYGIRVIKHGDQKARRGWGLGTMLRDAEGSTGQTSSSDGWMEASQLIGSRSERNESIPAFSMEIELGQPGMLAYYAHVRDDIEEAKAVFASNSLVTAVDNAAQWLYAGEYTDEQYENYERWAKE